MSYKNKIKEMIKRETIGINSEHSDTRKVLLFSINTVEKMLNEMADFILNKKEV